MNKAEYYEYLNSKAWQAKRELMLELFPTCQRCALPHEINVHHKTYERVGNERVPQDLEVLCKSCHMREHVTETEAVMSGLDLKELRLRIERRARESYEKNVDRWHELQKNKERDEEL